MEAFYFKQEGFSIYVHNINPFFYRLTENFGIRWYGLAYLISFILGYFYIRYFISKAQSRFLLSKDATTDFIFFYSILGVLIGGRLGFCIFYSPHLFLEFSSTIPFWGVLEVHKGGMSSHGGMIGVALSCYLYSIRSRISFHHLFDCLVPGAAIGFFFGRIANFINGELFGRIAPEGFRWAMKFPKEMLLWLSESYEKIQSLALVTEKLKGFQFKGHSLYVDQETWLTWIKEGNQKILSLIRLLIEKTQENDRTVIDLLEPILSPRYPSQLFQSFLEGFLVFILLNLIWLRPQKPGVLAASFGIFYAIARIIGEQFRMPDADLGFELFGLTRGQWLSLLLLGIGFIYLFFSLRSKTKKLGGWFAKH